MKNFSLKFSWWSVSLCQIIVLALFLLLVQFSSQIIASTLATAGQTLNPLFILLVMPLMMFGGVYVVFMIFAILLGPALMFTAKGQPEMLARNILSLVGWFTLLIFLYIATLFALPALLAKLS